MSLTSDARLGGDFARAAGDVREGLRLAPVWSYLALRDIRARYRRTLLGPLWIAGGVIATTVGLSIVFGGLFGQPLEEAIPYIGAGIVAWTLIGSMSFDAAPVMIGAAGSIKTLRLPHTFHMWRYATSALLVFAHNLVAFLLLVLVITRAVPVSVVLIPAIALVAAASLTWGLVVTLLAARFRDIQYMIGYLALVAFFLTPIFWRLEDLPPGRRALVEANPLVHMMELVRKPMLGELPDTSDWTVTLAVLGVGLVAAFFSLVRSRRRLVFWL